ncbi:hypothetical protein JCM19232_730 [Vibrio ishigakensis]|uniref:Uncharacterized protein n=1 Tax=Vibrio ishigakensis TaxID=1481914 RepID=A0A0B8P7B8_9VIBR|nr:hypothetical protein JCM19232_730 [Vibrio ishigakensis]
MLSMVWSSHSEITSLALGFIGSLISAKTVEEQDATSDKSKVALKTLFLT